MAWLGRPAGRRATPGARKVVVDFVGATLAGLDRSSGVTVQADVSRGRVLASAAYPVVGQPNRWRVTLDVAPERGVLADVRLFLKRGGSRSAKPC
nr:glucan biosynthesis protein [Sphingomonas sp. Ant20]